QWHPVGRGRPGVGLLLPRARGEGDAVAVVRHQAGVLERAAPQVPREIRDHTGSVTIALPHVHMPWGLLRVAEPMEKLEQLLGTPGLWQPQRVLGKGPPEGSA